MTVIVGSWVYRRKYFPRMPPRISYSARISSLVSGSGFILPPLSRCNSSRADDADRVSTFGVPNDHKVALFRNPGSEPTRFVSDVLRIKDTRRQGIAKHAACLLKSHSVLL